MTDPNELLNQLALAMRTGVEIKLKSRVSGELAAIVKTPSGYEGVTTGDEIVTVLSGAVRECSGWVSHHPASRSVPN